MASEALTSIVEFLRKTAEETPQTVPAMRSALEAAATLFPVPSGVECTPVQVDGVAAEWVAAAGSADDRIVVFLHGGAYALGSVNSHRSLIARISAATGARALAVEYRRAPEHPHPAALEDAQDAYRWLLQQGFDPRRIAIGGDSAGAALALSTLVAARVVGRPLASSLFCICPWVDLECTGDSWFTNAEHEPILRRDALLEMGRLYLDGCDPKTPWAAPIHAELHGLPPMLVQAGGADVLLDDARALASRARAANVEVTLELWDEMFHVWHSFPQLPEAGRAVAHIGDFVRKHMR